MIIPSGRSSMRNTPPVVTIRNPLQQASTDMRYSSQEPLSTLVLATATAYAPLPNPSRQMRRTKNSQIWGMHIDRHGATVTSAKTYDMVMIMAIWAAAFAFGLRSTDSNLFAPSPQRTADTIPNPSRPKRPVNNILSPIPWWCGILPRSSRTAERVSASKVKRSLPCTMRHDDDGTTARRAAYREDIVFREASSCSAH